MALVFATSLVIAGPAWADVAKLPADQIDATNASTSTPSPAPPITSPGTEQQVSYLGLSFDVPAGWPVVDLTADPTACVRVDVHVVYLGTPGAVQNCPAVVPGRTEAILLQPLPSNRPLGITTISPGALPNLTPDQRLAGEVVAQISGTDTLVTATFGTDPAVALDVFASLTVTAVAPRAALAPDTTVAPLVVPPPLDRSFTWYRGQGFDACTAPGLSTMQAWLASPYRSMGIYIGGNSRGCLQPNLTPAWVRGIATMGWKAQPIYDGVQAPCSTFSLRIASGQEATQGRAAALDAIAQARALGIGSGSDVYYDMEAYTPGTSCSGSVLKFLSAWTSTLRAGGYSSGVYSSLASGIHDVANPAAMPGFVAPDKIWIASWGANHGVYGYSSYVLDSQFSPYRRMNQFAGGHAETYGGVPINIDNDYLDTDPNGGDPFGQIDAVTAQQGHLQRLGD
jgi:Domain of unknown function (DUF1906)